MMIRYSENVRVSGLQFMSSSCLIRFFEAVVEMVQTMTIEYSIIYICVYS